MNLAQAEVLAAGLFDDHPAAVALLLESQHGSTLERRRRSWMALMALDPDSRPEHVDRVADLRESELAAPALAIADLLLFTVYAAKAADRQRAVRLLDGFCSRARRFVTSAEAA
jgi:hypothetical protein